MKLQLHLHRAKNVIFTLSQTLRKSNKVYALSDEKKNPAQSRWKIILHRGSFRRADQKSQWLGSSKVRLRLFLNLRKKKE